MLRGDGAHLCEHPNYVLSHACGCRRTWNHPFTELIEQPNTSAPLFDLAVDGEIAVR